MDAFKKGLDRGSAYMQRFSEERLATTTLKEFCAMGRLDAKQNYKTKKSIDQFASGWFALCNQYASLFKPDDDEQLVAEQEIKLIWGLLEQADKKLEKFLQWRKDNRQLHADIQSARDYINDAQCDMQDIVDRLKKSQQEA